MIISVLGTVGLVSPFSEAAEPVRHDLTVVIRPEAHHLSVQDRVTVPEDFSSEVTFSLHKGLNPSSPTAGVHLEGAGEPAESARFALFKVSLPAGRRSFVVEYGGTIHQLPEAYGKEQARGFKQTSGVISEQGVYLAGSSFWYPVVDDRLVTFSLEITVPSPWDAVSQGERTSHVQEGETTRVRWQEEAPQEDIYVIAAPFVEYGRSAGRIDAMVFLRTPDEALAGRYLDATVQYLAMYEKLIGPYPYEKFALVENFWETGYGMPSFTLLGPRIIRFPFILHSSYPHEILHNWWGNSVYPDFEKGNWSEGLTAYLSDHLIKETRGNGVDHRQETLQKYTDYVLSERDFPLTAFRSRHSSSSEAVGYGKSLMVFHMLRQELGDDLFVRGLQDFYRENRFRVASFDGLRKSFERVSGKGMAAYFDQWIEQSGAPELQVGGTRVEAAGDGYMLTAVLEQVQEGHVYHLSVPVAVTLEGREPAFQTVVVIEEKRLEFKVPVPARPVRLDVDPEFDLFRRLDREETPPALTQALGAKEVLVVLPASADRSLLKAYRDLARSLGQSGPDEMEVKLDRELEQFPSDRAVILLGWGNRFLSEVVSALSEYDVTVGQDGVRIGPVELPRQDHSVVLTARQAGNRDTSLTWVASDLPEALPGLGRKLPHYHKYSYLGFRGDEPDNVAKGRWPVLDSPMTVLIPREDGTISPVEKGIMVRREPLATLAPVFSKERMMETVRFLSSRDLMGRGMGTPELDRAARFIADRFEDAGLKKAGASQGGFFQTWADCQGDPERPVSMTNVVGIIPGGNPDRAGQSVVVGAHYDHLGRGWPDVLGENKGKIHPGADDNASGVSVLLELARVLAGSLKPERTVVFAAFAGEEAGRLGSRHYLSDPLGFPPDKCMGMLNIDTVGRLGKQKLLVLGAGSADEWVHIFRGAGFVTGVDVQTVSEELDASDQKSFHEAGVPAVQLFSGPHLDYHRPTDTGDKIDPDGLVKVASVAKEVVEYLAGREEPMTSTQGNGRSVASSTTSKRKVSLGTIPDFAYTGEGCRLSGIVPGSPAEACGLTEGDIIVKMGRAIGNLKDLSDALKALKSGDAVSVTFLREDKVMTVEATVVER